MNMLISHDFSDVQLSLFGHFDDLISVRSLVLMLIKVALDDSMSDFAQLLHFAHEDVILGVLLHGFNLGLSRDLLFLAIVEGAQLLLELSDLVTGHLLGCLHVVLSLVDLQIGASWHVNAWDVAILPELGLAGARLSVVTGDDWHLKFLRVLLLLSHQVADVHSKL